MNAALAILEAEPDAELKIGDVATKADVSVPTIYRHFGNKDGLFAAAGQALSDRMGAPSVHWGGGLLAALTGMCRFFEANRERIKLALTRPGLANVHRHSAVARDGVFQQGLAPHMQHLSEEEARAVAAIVRTIAGSSAWLDYRERHRLSAQTAARAVTWSMTTLVERLERDAAHHRDLSHASERSDA